MKFSVRLFDIGFDASDYGCSVFDCVKCVLMVSNKMNYSYVEIFQIYAHILHITFFKFS